MREIVVIVIFAACAATAGRAQTTVRQLRDIKSIYVGSFGEGESSNLIRSKIITSLVRSHRIDGVENGLAADAILVGAGQVTKEDFYSATAKDGKLNAAGGSADHATAGVRLVGRDERILWADDVSNSVWALNPTSSLADRIVKSLLNAIAQDAKRAPTKKP